MTNTAIRGFSLKNIWTIFTTYDPELYIPITFLSFQFNYLISGLNAWSYHAMNIVLHGLCAWCTLLVAEKFTASRRAGFLASLIVLVHPLQTEAVVWVAGRKDLLAALFALLSVFLYIRYRETAHRRWLHWCAGLLFVSLLSKASALLLPAIYLCIDRWMERRTWSWQLFSEKRWIFMVSLTAGLVAFAGKTRVVQASPPYELLLMAARSTLYYLQKFLLPIDLTPLVPWARPIQWTEPSIALSLVIIVAITATLALFWRKTRIPALVAVSCMLLLAPTFANVHKGQLIFLAVDRYAYMPIIALSIGIAAGLDSLTQSSRRLWGMILVPIIVLAYLSFAQTSTWKQNESMLLHSLSIYPDNVSARMSLATVYRESKRFDEERRVLKEGSNIRDHSAYQLGLGSIEARKGNFAAALAAYERARALDPENPEPSFFIGSLREQQGDLTGALEAYRDAYEMDDSYVAAINNAGAILMDRGDLEEAKELFLTATEWNKNFMEGEWNLYQILSMQRQFDEARVHLDRAYELAPEQPDIALAMGYALYEEGKFRDSEQVLQKLLRIDPTQRTALRLINEMRQQ